MKAVSDRDVRSAMSAGHLRTRKNTLSPNVGRTSLQRILNKCIRIGKPIRAAYQKQTEQLEKEIELQKAVKSITQSGGDEEEEESDFKAESGSMTKATINGCSLLLKKLGKSDVKLVSSITKAVAVSSLEEKKLKKRKRR